MDKQVAQPVHPTPGNPEVKPKADYRGFVAGVFSGIAKLSGMRIYLRRDRDATANNTSGPSVCDDEPVLSTSTPLTAQIRHGQGTTTDE